jgi:hypothetical protein
MRKFLFLSAVLSLSATFAAAQQTCTATTASVIGSYTYIATEFPFSTSVLNPPGTITTTTSQTYSNSQIGTLLQSVLGGGAFSSANVLYFDGAGHISIAASSSSFTASSVIGTYTVNGDCTIGVTLTDTLNNTTNSAGGANTQATTSMIGFVAGGGAEIYLTEPQSSSSTNGNTPLVTGQFASRLSIELIRTYTYGCSVGSLSGSYGLIGSGFVETGTPATTQSVQPVTLFAVVTFDGGGHIIQQTVAPGSSLGNFQYTGSYSVNANCAGTMTLTPIGSTTTTGTTTGTTTSTASPLTVNFVLTPPLTYATTNAYSATPSGYSSRPGIEFTFMSGTETLMGMGIAQ